MNRRLSFDVGVILFTMVTIAWTALVMFVVLKAAITSSQATDQQVLLLSAGSAAWLGAQILAWAVFFADLARRDIQPKLPWAFGFILAGAFVIPIYYAVHVRPENAQGQP